MKVGFLCASTLNSFNFRVADKIIATRTGDNFIGFIDTRATKSLLSKLIHNLRRGRGGYIFVMLLTKIFRKKPEHYDSSAIFSSYGIPYFITQKPYSEDFLEEIRNQDLDVLVYLSGFGIIIKKPLLDIVPKGILSYHHGNMRKYRGQPAGFWEIYHGENSMGVTVQRLSEGIDTGEPIAERSVKILRTDSHRRLKERFYEESVDLMLLALNKFDSKSFSNPLIQEYGSLYTLPNLRQWLILQIRILFRRLSEYLHFISNENK